MTPRKLTLVAPLLALFGFGPCSRVTLDNSSANEDGSGSAADAGTGGIADTGLTDPGGSEPVSFGPAASPTASDTQCYFASFPAGSKHCILASCYIVEPSYEFPTCYGSDADGTFMGYSDGSTLYVARDLRETSIVYANGSAMFPACGAPGDEPMSLPTGSGAYYATGLTFPSASPTDVATVCDDVTGSGTSFGVVEPTVSSDQCYFTSYPVGSKQCIAAPCQMTDVADPSDLIADMICTGGSNSRMYLLGQTLYATSPTGDIQELIPRGTLWFDWCMGSTNGTLLPTDAGDYYATGLVVGSASPSDLAPFCE